MLTILKMSITSFGIFVTTDRDDTRSITIPGISRTTRKNCEVLIFHGIYDPSIVWAYLLREFGEGNLETGATYGISETIRYSQLRTVRNKPQIVRSPDMRTERNLSWETELTCN